MKNFKLVFAIWSVKIAFCLAADVPGGYYTSRYDALDIDDILNHKRLVYHYAACLLNRGPCPPQALDLKRKFYFLKFDLYYVYLYIFHSYNYKYSTVQLSYANFINCIESTKCF